MSIHADVPPEQSNETLAGFVPPPGAPVTVRTDIPPVSTTGAQCFGEYEVVGELGEGGMGRVYKARHRTLGQFVAVKVLTLNDPAGRERFRAEALTTAKLEHANIVRVIDVQTPPDGRPYLVMEFADGGSLDRELNSTPQNPYRAAEMLETIARAVHFAHEHQVIHRDLKPANVLRSRDGTLKLTDFGLAKQMDSVSGLTRTGALLGTPQYMAPEQADGRTHEFGPAVDIYALGAILYEMLTGRPPFRGVTVMETLEQVRRDDPAPPSRLVPRLPRDLSVICLKCLEKAPGRRYATAGDLADDLRRWLKGEPIVARAASRWERLIRQVARRPWEAAAVAASVLLLLVLVGVWVMTERRAAADRDREEQQAHQKELEDAKDRADKVRAEQQELAAKKLREQAAGSLAALNTIRALVLDGELSRTPKLGKLHEALGAYYQDLLAQKDTGFDRAELADGLVKVGDLFQRTGDKVRAHTAYERVEELCRDSTDERVRLARAEGRVKAARARFDLGQLPAAETALAEAEALWRAARGTALGAARAESHLGEVCHLRGQVFTRRRDFAEAEAAFTEAIKYRKELARAPLARDAGAFAALAPDDRKRELEYLRDLGRGYGYRGDVLLELDRTADADRDYWESHRIRSKVWELVQGGANRGEASDAQQQVARSWGNFADMHTRGRALGTALHFAEQSLNLHKKLADEDPSSVEYKSDLWARMNAVAELRLFAGGDADGRRAVARQVLAELPPLRRLDDLPEDVSTDETKRSAQLRAVLATTHALRAIAHTALGERRGARDEATAANKLFEKLCAAERPDPRHLYFWAAAKSVMAETEERAGSAADWRRDALDSLARAAKLRFRDRHPNDIVAFRGFATFTPAPGVTGEPAESAKRFRELLDEFRAAPAPKK